MIERIETVIADLRWILRTCRVASVLPIETFEQMLPLSGVALTQAVHDGCAELRECLATEYAAGHELCAGYLSTTLCLVKYI
jgi:hypothetical protein